MNPSDDAKYEDSIKILINYAQREYSTGVYLIQTIREVKVQDLALPTKLNKDKNKSAVKFDM